MDKSGNRGHIYKVIDATVGTKYLLEVRNAFKKVVLDKSNKFNHWNPVKKSTQRAGLQAAKEARSVRLEKLTMIPSLAAFVGGMVFDGVHLIVPLMGLLLFTIIAIRRTAVEVLLYPNPYELRSPADIKFAYVWNTAMSGWTSFGILPVALLARLHPTSYTMGMWIIDKIVEEYDAIKFK